MGQLIKRVTVADAFAGNLGLSKPKAAPLDAFDLEALQAFAKAHGRKWKSTLTDVYWYNARIWEGPKPGMGTALHGLRNNLGPSWLRDFKLPEAEA